MPVHLHDGSTLYVMLHVPQTAARLPPVARIEAPVADALSDLDTGDAPWRNACDKVRRVLGKPISVLIQGESGVGKEMFARAAHASGPRRNKPFVAINCAAVPENLIEAELFGYAPGAFTGARREGSPGRLREAHGGTLFLDEIGDMPLPLQARLLRVLSEHEVLPVGALKPVPVNIRVIAATHAPLEAMVHARRFRDDLYYRLNGAHFSLPPLRQRADLGATLDRMLGERTLTAAARERLMAYAWPGNLRELKNVLDYAASMSAGQAIDVQDLPELTQAAEQPTSSPARLVHPSPQTAPQPASAAALLLALRLAHWNVSEVARQMGLSRMTLYRRMKRAGIVAPNRE